MMELSYIVIETVGIFDAVRLNRELKKARERITGLDIPILLENGQERFFGTAFFRGVNR